MICFQNIYYNIYKMYIIFEVVIKSSETDKQYG